MNRITIQDVAGLANDLKQEKLFIDSEKQHIGLLNEKVVKAFEEVFQSCWVRAENRRNYHDLLAPDSSPAGCCQIANQLHSLTFIPSYKKLGSKDALYGSLMSGLRDSPGLLTKLLILGDNHCPSIMKDLVHTVFSSLYANCILPEDHNSVLLILRDLMKEQVCKSTNPLRLLRNSTCAFSLLYKVYVDTLPEAKVFLTAALHQPLLQLLVEDDLYLDIDANKAAHRFPPLVRQRKFGEEGTPEYEAALAKYKTFVMHKLAEVTNRFVIQLYNSMQCFPPTLLWLVRSLYQNFLDDKLLLDINNGDDKNRGSRQETEITACCIDLIMMQLLCPALVTPEIYGVCDAPVSHIARYNLMQIGELLQMLALSRCEPIAGNRLSDMQSFLNVREMRETVSIILDGPAVDTQPVVKMNESNPLQGMNREICFIPHPHVDRFLGFLFYVKEHLTAEERLLLEQLMGSIQAPSTPLVPRSPTVNGVHASPPLTNGALSVSPSTGATAKKSLINRVKSSRNKMARASSGEAEVNSSNAQDPNDSLNVNAIISAIGGNGRHSPSNDPASPDESSSLSYDSVLMMMMPSNAMSVMPGLKSEEKILADAKVREEEEDNDVPNGEGEGSLIVVEKRTRFSLSHDDGSIGNTSDNLEAVSEAASNHSVASSLDDVVQEDQPDNLSDMMSANVSGRGTPNVSGRDTPSSQVTDGDDLPQAGGVIRGVDGAPMELRGVDEGDENLLMERRQNIPVVVAVPKPASQEIEDKFGKFEIKPLMGGDETFSLVSDTWSTDVLASDSETIEAVDVRDERQELHDQLLNRHLQDLDRIRYQHDAAGPVVAVGPGIAGGSVETFETASEAWSTDGLLTTDSDRLQEFDTDDSQSVARSDDAGRSEVEGDGSEAGGAVVNIIRPPENIIDNLIDLQDDRTPRVRVSRAPTNDSHRNSSIIVKPTPIMLPAALSLDSATEGGGNSGPSGTLKPSMAAEGSPLPPSSAPPIIGFRPIQSNATQTQPDLLKLDDQDSTDVVEASKPSIPLIPEPTSSTTSNTESNFRVNSKESSLSANYKMTNGSSNDDSSIHLSTTSLLSCSSSSSESNDLNGAAKKQTKAPLNNLAATGAIPKSISFDKNVSIKSSDRDSIISDGDVSNRNKRGFFRKIKLGVFKHKRSKDGTREDYYNNVQVNGNRASGSNYNERKEEICPTISESSDDILNKYRNKKYRNDVEVDGPVCNEESVPVCVEADERLIIDQDDIESSYAFTDAKRKLRLVLSESDNFGDMNTFIQDAKGRAMYTHSRNNSNSTVVNCLDRPLPVGPLSVWLSKQIASARSIQDRELFARLMEANRCLQLFDEKGEEQLISALLCDHQRRAPYITYLVRSRQGLLTTLNHLQRLQRRVLSDTSVITSSLVNKCVELFLERPDVHLREFTRTFNTLNAPDEKVQHVSQFLDQLSHQMRTNAIWKNISEDQAVLAESALEQCVMAHIYDYALYPNGDVDINRDQVLSDHINKLSTIITPNHKALRIPNIYQYECPWPSAQMELSLLSAYKTAGDKLTCVVRAAKTVINLLSLAHTSSVPAADDFMPVFVYVLIKANPPHLLSTNQYVSVYYEQRMEGEQRYYWTQFASAIEFIKTMDYSQ